MVVIAVALAVHGPSVAFGFTYLDDYDLVVDDAAFLAHPGSLFGAFGRSYMHVVDAQHPYYRPLVTLSYALDAHWSGTHPFGYHLTNVVLHALASAACFALLRQLAFGRVVACLAALAFALDPATASAVAWIPGRNDLLLAVFALGAWIALVADCARPSWGRRGVHLTLFALALLTKETALALLVVYASHLALAPPTRGATGAPQVRLASLYAGWAGCVAARVALGSRLGLDPWRAVSAGDFAHLASLVVTGLGQVLFPVNPALLRASTDSSLGPGIVALFAVAAIARFLPGVRVPVLALGGIAFVASYAPSLAASGTNVTTTRLYLPSCGVALVVAEVLRTLSRPRAISTPFAAATLAMLAAMTLAYEATFRNRRAFARAAVEASPHCALAHFCLGQSYQMDGDRARALVEYEDALRLGAVEVIHNNVAVIYIASGRWADAERELREELAVQPRYGLAHHNLAIVLRRLGREEEARSEEKAAEIAGR